MQPGQQSTLHALAHRSRQRLGSFGTPDWLALALLILYVVVFTTMTIRRHDSFNTAALDLAKFDQSIWNTSQGRPYETTISEDSVNHSHFSPALALFAPLYWLWSDIRLLFLAQSALLGGAGLFLYLHHRRNAAWLGLAVFAAYLMHPTLHQVNLVDFRRETLAVFAASFALYHLFRKQYGWMALGLLVVLLSKEDLSLLVIAVGVYIVTVQRQWRIGTLTMAIGAAWFVLVPFALLPALMTNDQIEGYQHAGASYGYLGQTLPEIGRTLLTNPGVLWDYIGQEKRLLALLRFLWPTAFLFLLAPEVALLMLPNLLVLLSSTSQTMGRLESWYPSVLIAVLFWAVAVGVGRLHGRWRAAGAAALIVAGLSGWLLLSPLWPGPRFDPERYRISAQERAAVERLSLIPAEASVMAQDALVPHLSHRRVIHLFPWLRGGEPADYVVLNRDMPTYPLGADEYRTAFYDILTDPAYTIVDQVGELVVLRRDAAAAPASTADVVWDEALRLKGFEVAVAPLPESAFTPLPAGGMLPAGSRLRVSLLWETLAPMEANYTVFVHAVAPDGRVLAQHDSWPADAHRPTSVLEPGLAFRDVHFLTLSEDTAAADLTFRTGLYIAETGELLQTATGADFATLAP